MRAESISTGSGSALTLALSPWERGFAEYLLISCGVSNTGLFDALAQG
jgi:hypothetical protein